MEVDEVYTRIQQTVLEIREEMDCYDRYKCVYMKMMKMLQKLSTQYMDAEVKIKAKTTYLRMLLDMEQNISGQNPEVKLEPPAEPMEQTAGVGVGVGVGQDALYNYQQ